MLLTWQGEQKPGEQLNTGTATDVELLQQARPIALELLRVGLVALGVVPSAVLLGIGSRSLSMSCPCARADVRIRSASGRRHPRPDLLPEDRPIVANETPAPRRRPRKSRYTIQMTRTGCPVVDRSTASPPRRCRAAGRRSCQNCSTCSAGLIVSGRNENPPQGARTGPLPRDAHDSANNQARHRHMRVP